MKRLTNIWLSKSQSCCSPQAPVGPYDKTILFLPIANGNTELVRMLIDKGASVTADLDGYTPTELAKKYGQEAVYQLPVSRGGVPVDARSSAQLALVEAAGKADVEGMERAVKNGARINDFDANNRTALIAAVRWGWLRAIRSSGCSITEQTPTKTATVDCGIWKAFLSTSSSL
jgi:ankyrin repeat protein